MAGADDVAEKLASQNWEDVTRKLLVFAHRRLRRRSIETAKEVVQEALTRIYDPTYKDWDPKEEPDLVKHLQSVVNGIVANIHASPVEGGTRVYEPDVVERIADRVISADARLEERIDARDVVSLLLKRTEKEELVQAVLLLMSDGWDKPAEQAARLERPVEQIYRARRRLNEHADAVRNELQKGTDRGT